MWPLTTLVKIYRTKYFCNAKVAGLSEIFVRSKVFGCTIHYGSNCYCCLVHFLGEGDQPEASGG